MKITETRLKRPKRRFFDSFSRFISLRGVHMRKQCSNY